MGKSGRKKVFSGFEHRKQPLLKPKGFYLRILRYTVKSSALVGISVTLGMVGYVVFESMTWENAFLNATAALSGLGIVHPIGTTSGKVFAGFYSLFASLVFVVAAGILFAPMVHRLLHWMHLDENDLTDENS